MLDALITIGGALFMTKFWSLWRYGYFDWFCAAAAVAGAFIAPALLETLAPEAAALGVFGAEPGGALVGCVIYDALAYRRR
jgi:hypothetical protein